MNIHIKNIQFDHSSPNSIGFNCGRFMTKRMRELNIRNTNLGNPHPIGYCQKCSTFHDREACIEACKNDFNWQYKLDIFVKLILPSCQPFETIDLWCWCYPEACHCELVRDAILNNSSSESLQT